jgi:hypothetical protein
MRISWAHLKSADKPYLFPYLPSMLDVHKIEGIFLLFSLI